jgi:hypothetical protein
MPPRARQGSSKWRIKNDEEWMRTDEWGREATRQRLKAKGGKQEWCESLRLEAAAYWVRATFFRLMLFVVTSP